jgi:homoserine dehydrogenase
MRKLIHPSYLKPVSFTCINVKDMNYATELGYRIKPIALITSANEYLEYKIGPCLVRSEHIVANTYNNFNSIILEGENCGEIGFYGQGAGAKPTAAAMFDDLVNIINSTAIKHIDFEKISGEQVIDYHSNLYWRLTVKNHIGVLASISSLFAENKINIEKIIQKKEDVLFNQMQDAEDLRNKYLGKETEKRIEIVLLTTNVSNEKKEDIEKQFASNEIAIDSCIPFV